MVRAQSDSEELFKPISVSNQLIDLRPPRLPAAVL